LRQRNKPKIQRESEEKEEEKENALCKFHIRVSGKNEGFENW